MEKFVYKKVVLVVFDGFGIASPSVGNAISQAKTPTLNYVAQNYPCLTLQASGPLVGLPWGEMGNSEVGHLNIGAGRIVGQDLPRITSSVQSGEFFKNPAFLKAVEHAKKHNSALQLVGMVSPGGVHSLDEHLYALLGVAAENGLKRVFVHMFTDGRDTQEKVALDSLEKLRARIVRLGVGEIASIAGRFYAMDRGGHWNQTQMIFDCMVYGKGEQFSSPEDCVKKNYSEQIFDEMIKPSVIVEENGKPKGKISDSDAVIFFNFRQDRALQLAQMFTNSVKVPSAFKANIPQNLFFVSMTEYENNMPMQVAFPPIDMKNNLAEFLSKNKLTQFHISESEKFAHVTSFFNCGNSEKLPGEERVIVASPENSRNYVDHPQMSSVQLTEILCDKILKSNTNFFIANYANGDMVGHTGKLQAAIEAVEALDACLNKLVQAALDEKAVLILTADHGNCEQMLDSQTGEINKDHTTNPVPFLVVAKELKFKNTKDVVFASLSSEVPSGVISDIAPTVLELFGLEKPLEMTGVSLLENIKSNIVA